MPTVENVEFAAESTPRKWAPRLCNIWQPPLLYAQDQHAGDNAL